MKKPVVIILGVVLVGAGGAGAWWYRAQQRSAIVRQAVPEKPDLSQGAAPLRARVTDADERARAGAVDALAELSRLYHANGYLTQAIQCYQALEQLQPKEPIWLHRHASILAGYGEVEPALALWQRVSELAPDYIPAQLRRADVCLKMNRSDDARRSYEAVLKREPQNPYAQLGLARIAWEKGDLQQARQLLEPLVAQTNYELGYDLIVSVYERLGEQARAAAIRGQMRASGAYRDPADPWIDELMEDCYDPFRLSLAAGMAGRIGQADTALRYLTRATQLAPDDVGPRFQLGTMYLAKKDLTSAAREFEQCTKISPAFADGWAQLAGVYADLGDASAAVRTVLAGLGHCPDSPGLHLMRARQLQQAGETDEAIQEFHTSIRLRPNEAAAYVELGTLLIKLNRVDEGIAQLTKVLEAEPDNPSALGILAYHAIGTGQQAEAQRWMQRVANQPRMNPKEVESLNAAYRGTFGQEPPRPSDSLR